MPIVFTRSIFHALGLHIRGRVRARRPGGPERAGGREPGGEDRRLRAGHRRLRARLPAAGRGAEDPREVDGAGKAAEGGQVHQQERRVSTKVALIFVCLFVCLNLYLFMKAQIGLQAAFHWGHEGRGKGQTKYITEIQLHRFESLYFQ